MTGYKAALRSSAVYNGHWQPFRGCASAMSKKYQEVRDRIALPGGGFIEAVRMAFVDLSCFGEGHRLDLSGYPHETEAAALLSDWAALGVDFKMAAQKVLDQQEEGRAGGGAIEGRPGKTD